MRHASKLGLALGVMLCSAAARAEVKVAKRSRHGSSAGGGGARVSWLGFRPTEAGRSEVFLLLTQAVTPREALVGDRLYVMFDGVGLGKRGQTRALDTRFFETPVAYVKLTAVGHGGCKDCGRLGSHGRRHHHHRDRDRDQDDDRDQDHERGDEPVSESAQPGPSMSGAGIVVTVLFKHGAGTEHDVASEDSTYDPEPPPRHRDGTAIQDARPLQAVHRTLVRVGFPRYSSTVADDSLPAGGHRGRVVSPEPQAPQGSDRPLVTEAAPKKIAIPPEPKSKPKKQKQ